MRNDERHLWQTNVYMNVVLVYFTLELVFAPAQYLASHLGSLVVNVGLLCDYFVAWSIAASMMLPVEFYVAADEVDVRRGDLILLYVFLGVALILRTVVFVRFVVRQLAPRG